MKLIWALAGAVCYAILSSESESKENPANKLEPGNKEKAEAYTALVSAANKASNQMPQDPWQTREPIYSPADWHTGLYL